MLRLSTRFLTSSIKSIPSRSIANMSAAASHSGGKRIVFTGGSGKAGRHVIPYLLSKGHTVLNLDLTPFPAENDPEGKVFTLKTDLTDSGQVFNALTTHFNYAGYEGPSVPSPPDAVIHFAAYARNMMVPDNETFRANVVSTYNIVEAASKLGVKNIIVASSETTYGVCFSQGDTDYHSFPLEETYDVDPMDSYALSKICGEKTARSFARRYGNEIYVFRIGNVIEPHEYESISTPVPRYVLDTTLTHYLGDFPRHVGKPETRKRNAWSYIDARDLGQMCHLAINKTGLGFEIFNATNDNITTTTPTKEFLAKTCPDVKVTREMEEFEAPLTNRKIKEVLGFKQEHDWRMYYKP